MKKSVVLIVVILLFLQLPSFSLHSDIIENDTLHTYVLITQDSLMNSFQPLIHWINRKGTRAEMVSIDTVLKYYSGDSVSGIFDDAGALRGFLIDRYQNGLEWVLLGGDEEIIPVRYGYTQGDNTCDRNPPSDLYYSDLDGNWNVDGDTLYGEYPDDSVNSTPEVYVGRVPADRTGEIENWVEKVLSYEINPGNGNPDYLIRSFWTGADELRSAPEQIIRYGSFPGYFIHDTTMLEDSGGIHPRGSEVVNRMNLHFGWYNLYGHGQVDNIVVSCPGGNHPSLDRDMLWSLEICDSIFHANHWGNNVEYGNGLDSMLNHGTYGIMYASSCFQGAYDFENFSLFNNYHGPSMAESFTLLPDGGGPTFFGFTRGIELSTAIHYSLLEVIFEDSITAAGKAHALAKTQNYSHKIWLTHTLFGDPLMPVWTDVPVSQSAAFPDSIPPDSFDFNISVREGWMPLSDALVCLWKEGEVYERGYTDGNGELELAVKPVTEGDMLLTVTSMNHYPILDTVLVDSGAAGVSEPPMADKFTCKPSSQISTRINFRLFLPEPGEVVLKVFDPAGRNICKLYRSFTEIGPHEMKISGEDRELFKSGIYFFRVEYEGIVESGKFVFLR